MGCYRENCLAKLGTLAGRFSWSGMLVYCDGNGTTGDYLELTALSSIILAILLMIGGIEQNPDPCVEV